MNSSRIIKSARQGSDNGILITRPGAAESGGGGFHALSSMWQSDDKELAAALSELEKEKERIRQESEAMQAEAAAMVAAAQARAAQIEKDAYDKGAAAGKAEIMAQEKARFEKTAAEVAALLVGIEKDRQRLYEHYEADILTLIKAMVDRVLFHEVTVNPQVIEVCLKTALAYAVENSSVTIRLHGQDLERLRQVVMDKPEILAGYKKIELSEDPSISQGGCALDTGFGEIDATLDSRRDKVFAAIDAVLKKAVEVVK